MAEPSGLADFERIHLVGAGGAGMRGLATLLAGRGHVVTGSDLAASVHLERLNRAGITAWAGHHPERAAQWDLAVASSAVPDTDPELVAAAAAGIPVWRRPRLLGALTEVMPAIGITGTHGKTTGSALAVTALQATGADPSFLVGGDLVGLDTGARLADPDVFVLEADEAFGTFLELRLRGLVVTNVEVDHLDHYGTVDRLEEAFLTVARGVAGPVVVGIDGAGGARLAAGVDGITYGMDGGADWVVGDVKHGAWEVSFVLTGPDSEVPVTVPRPGLHVAADAAGVLVLLAALGYDPARAAAGLAGFPGVRRRHELRGCAAGVTVIDDYAHHPTEVAATLAAAGSADWNRVWAVFQPHRYSRTQELAAGLGAALVPADRVVVTGIYGAGDEPLPGVEGDLVATAAAAAGAARVEYVPARAELAGHLAAAVEPGDLVLLLGAGDVGLVADELLGLLEAGP